jgi:hypothetical protein
MINRRYTKIGMREAHQEQMENTFRLRTVPGSSDKDLIAMRDHMAGLLASIHARFRFKRERLQCKLGIVNNELHKRAVTQERF